MTSMVRIAVVVGLILLIPLAGTLLRNIYGVGGWNWGIGDFIFGFVLLFSTGAAIDWAVRTLTNPVYRAIATTAIVLALVLIWVEIVTDAVSGTITALF